MAAEPPVEPLVERVRKAIERGVQYLRDQEAGKGGWEHIDPVASNLHPGGRTCLALLALMNTGVRPEDPIVERGLRVLRKIEPRQTYVVALQTMVFADAGRNEDKERIQRNVDWLLDQRLFVNGEFRGWSYGTVRGAEGGDNSNTQYALLGLHAGHLSGARIDRKVWQSIQTYYLDSQQKDAGWAYKPASNATTFTMTTAGLCGLLIAGMELNLGREILNGNGTAQNCGQYEDNKPLGNALGWIGSKFSVRQRSNTFYSLYGVERAGRLSGLRFLGNHDWYRAGCQFLVEGQSRQDGSWSETEAIGTPSRIITTSFALLFLSKGRTPILMSKLYHGPGDDWNNDRYDCRNLVDYASKELFHRQPLAWQIFDCRRVSVTNNEELRALTSELLQSPIVYFNGHEAPRFSDLERSLLKEYVEQGGFILAESCCGAVGFDKGFRQLARELWPDNPLKPLGPEHPLWKAHALIPPGEFPLEGIEMGCKTVVIYSPRDLSCLWEANSVKEPRGLLAFRLGGNIIAYATGLEPPKPRLTASDIVKLEPEGKLIPRGYLKVAQLRHDGDWQPAPKAMQTLMSNLREKAKLDVALQTEPMRPNHPDLVDFKFLYMHGRAAFSFSPEEIKNLRMNLETGGLILADACCGKPAFDSAFREFAKQLFPDKRLEPVPLTDELYSKELNGTALTTVRCRTEVGAGTGKGGEFRDLPPALEGIRLNNRWVVLYSRYDLGCALEKHQSTDCLGHDHASALRLGTAAVLYALQY